MTRYHWNIENCLHWVLDIALREDECRCRCHIVARRGKDYGPHNFTILRHSALNLLKQKQTCKLGIKNKRLNAGWDVSYVLRAL
jgi:predicted transposase YbfD/YdcC